ncbi:cytochrome c biogenesis CcdA family protein [Polaromonas sp.]|uniref:cytochrome c biogenesis CcdA family protein n=1 Tax=Polaromonas sp. TaxID=1869339 RepID=UPI002FC7CF03
MDVDTLRQAVEQFRYASLGWGFLAGLFFSVNPIAMAAIPVSLAYVTRAHEKPTALRFGAMFILGLIVTHVVLGAVAGLGGQWVERLLGRYWGAALGPLLILMGLLWPGWIRLPLPAASFKAKRVTGMWGAFALGVPFSVAICPICTPALVALLGVVAALGSPLLGATVLLAFAIGRAIPIGLGAWAIGWLEDLKPLARYQRAFDVVGGIVLVLAGLYMLNVYYIVVPELAGMP